MKKKWSAQRVKHTCLNQQAIIVFMLAWARVYDDIKDLKNELLSNFNKTSDVHLDELFDQYENFKRWIKFKKTNRNTASPRLNQHKSPYMTYKSCL